MINVVCKVKNQMKQDSEVIVRSATKRKDRDYYLDVVEIEINGEVCLVDVMDIQDAIDKCSMRRGRRGRYNRDYVPSHYIAERDDNTEDEGSDI